MNKKQNYTRFAKISIAEGLALIRDQRGMPEKANRVKVQGYPVHLTSLRLRTFYYKGTVCKKCGLSANFFAVEHQPKSGSMYPHLNMYGITEEGEEVLFTKDHIQSKKNGGRDVLDNMQTMCRPCNNSKGSKNG